MTAQKYKKDHPPEFWMAKAVEWADAISDDPHTKVGCVIVWPQNFLRGANRLPAGVAKTDATRFERPEKYLWIEHAEREAIAAAARIGRSTAGAAMYLPWFPCPGCARAIVNAGIAKLFCYYPTADELADPKWKFDRSLATLVEGGVEIVKVEKPS